ncbi:MULTISPECIES: MFS transporter [Thermoanaerobacterium]|nr:MFS transporter [Thermoanaerobacterium xylanolyticum]
MMKIDDKDKKVAISVILLLGIVSAFGDITYEGARSVYGPYLKLLGANALIVGIVTGIGEFLASAIRIPVGYAIDKTSKPWLWTILGYGMLISVPLLAITGKWPIAALLIILERTGKAIRSPGKDTILSHVSKKIGTGLGFGLHELLDQIGGIIGPLIFTFVISFAGSYKTGFILMWIPAILTVIFVIYARSKVTNPAELEKNTKNASKNVDLLNKNFSRQYLYYMLFIFFAMLGFANYPIISYHFLSHKVLSQDAIPLLYALAMAVDGVSAVFIGKFYDKKGFLSLAVLPISTFLMTFMVFSNMPVLAIVSMLIWGFITSMQETTMRSVITDITYISERGKAFGVFSAVTGFSMFLGSTIFGYLYAHSINFIFLYSIIAEMIALFWYVLFVRSSR